MLDFDVNWLAVAVAVIAAFAVGMVWYSPILFGKIWQREAKLTDADIAAGNMVLIFGTTAVMAAVAAVLFAAHLGPEPELSDSVLFGLIVGAGWVATSFATGYLFERRSFTLWLINAGYNVALFLAIGLIIGVWP